MDLIKSNSQRNDLAQVPMADQYLLLRAESLRQFFNNIYRTMLPARATNGNRQCCAIVAYERGQPAHQEGRDVVDKVRHVQIGLKKRPYRAILAGQGSQHGVIKWIRQETRIEYQVGIDWNAVLETK